MAYDDNMNYPNPWIWYNSERRDSAGMVDDTLESPYVYHFHGTNHFILNLTGHTSANNPQETTMFTYSNGVRMVFSSWYNEDPDEYDINYKIKFYDKDGNLINTEQATQSYSVPKSIYSGVSHIDLWYASSVTTYSQSGHTVTSPAGRVMFRRDSGSPYDPPDITNNDVERTEFRNYYGFMDVPNIFGTTLDDYINGIELNGDDTPITPKLPSEDTSTPGGGDDANPDYNPFSDSVDFPGLPTGGSAIASGFIRVYNPTSAQLTALANKLWDKNPLHDFADTISKIMNDPMEAMISLHSVPFQVVGGSSTNIKIGNYDSEVSAIPVTTQYYTLNCGNISLPEHWASALDYSPYTTCEIFIPFVGVRPLQIDDVMGRVLTLKYNIDILTGSAIAMLKCGDSVLYTYNTQIHTEIPYTMSSYGRLVQSIISVAGTAIGATAGGAGALLGTTIGGAIGTAMSKHSDISRGGSLGGAVGVMGDFTPYLIIHRPIQSLASDFASKKGYPSNISATLSSVSGYTVVDKVHLTDIDCTDSERDEIHALLKEGVII